MSTRETELIAILLGDAPPSPAMTRWLTTAAGRRELGAYEKTLRALRRLYGAVRVPPTPPVYYTALRTPIGRVAVAATDAGLVRIAFRRSAAAFASELRQRLHAEVIESADKLAGAVGQITAYFAGERRRFDVPIDLRMATPFQRRVLRATASVPAGRVVSYGEIAQRIGCPRGSRAVGQALGRNPIPIVIPCHRIVAADGGLGGYTGGLEIKKKLLAIEGVGAR
jgi:methylated-DNA-[protein]-cysteine S-methyltransferase